MIEKNENKLSGSCDTGGCSCACGTLVGSVTQGLVFLAVIAGSFFLISSLYNGEDNQNGAVPSAEGVPEPGRAQAGVPESAKQNDSRGVVQIASASDFESKVVKAGKSALVVFSADWCPACKTYDPLFEKAAAALGEKALFFKVDVDKARPLSAQYKIQFLPTTVLFRDGKESTRFTGPKTADAIKSML